MPDLIPHAAPDTTLAQRPAANGLAALLTGGRAETAKALAAAVTSCHAVEKTAQNVFHRYKYASADAIIEEARKALADAGLALLPIEASLNGSEREGDDRFELVRTFALLHASGEVTPLRVVWPVCVEKGRPLDKATAIADTLSLSYLLRDLLMLPRVDPTDDMNARDDRAREERRPERPRKKTNLPADGAELEARIIRRDKALADAGRAQMGELLAHIVRQGIMLGHPPELARWGADVIGLTPDWVRTFEAAHPAPAAPVPEPPPSPQNGTTPPLPPQRITPEQVRQLHGLLERKGRKWLTVVHAFGFPSGRMPADLTPIQYAEVTQCLNEEPDKVAKGGAWPGT
jgi:ERF superfamily protein